ncbi:MAG: class I SAM-dependent methyltransferase [Verrucomicrobia bacterium]|nr:class I SAM-dependent methyltransferase [Verrucomicrobiota bacterium]MBU4366064.1 class I SAM-dependent methyltransferase [Verrucomicrobiota bacterium]
MCLTDILQDTCARDQRVWDACASVYEDRIVGGHPDVTAYEGFEEDLLDRVLLYLARERKKRLCLYDVGCGSGRLHLRYAMKTTSVAQLKPADAQLLERARRKNPAFAYDPLWAEQLVSVGGVDFSTQMLELARAKLRKNGLGSLLDHKIFFDHGSAFDLQPMEGEPFPVAISVCNSIGVMQGPEGATKLFKAMRRAVESAGGIAIISGYRREAVATFALCNYESTMDVSGQPRWLIPDKYATSHYVQVPRAYKRAHSTDECVVVDVRDTDGNIVKEGHVLTRDNDAVRETVATGHIRTHTAYTSHWYAFDVFEEWIAKHWPSSNAYHIAGKDLDALRGEPMQMAILDTNGELKGLMQRWGCMPERNGAT